MYRHSPNGERGTNANHGFNRKGVGDGDPSLSELYDGGGSLSGKD